MNKIKKILSVILAVCVCITILYVPKASYAEETEENADVLTLKIGDTLYENVKTGTTIVGDFDLDNLEFWVVSYNGHTLENVGNNSGVQDSQGRNPLEVATNKKTDTLWTVTLIYHSEDDPVVANQAYGFNIAGIIFSTSADSEVEVPTVSKVKSVKAISKSKSLKLTWKKSDVDGYQIQYSTNKNFKSATKVTVEKDKTTYTIKKLKAKKTYYVRIRGYKTYTDNLNNEQTVYGEWVTVHKKTK